MFKILMNLVFHEKLDEFVIIYIDDIFVYSRTIKTNMTHLDVLSKLKKIFFFSKKVNSEFALKKLNFLGHVLTWERFRPNLRKLEVVNYWQRAIMAKNTKSFLGVTNFYRKFIKRFSHITKPFIDFLKNNCPLIGEKTKRKLLMI